MKQLSMIVSSWFYEVRIFDIGCNEPMMQGVIISLKQETNAEYKSTSHRAQKLLG